MANGNPISMSPMAIQLLGMVLKVLDRVRAFASQYPEKAVREKVTPEWLTRRGEKSFPEIIEVIKANGERGQAWLSRQADEIVKYCLGKLVWDKSSGKVVCLG